MRACMLAQSCPLCLTLCDPIDCSPPSSSVHGISQARILEWVVMPSSRRPSRPRDQTCISCISCIDRQIHYCWATREANVYLTQFSSVQSLSHVWLFATPCTAAHQASLSITNSRSLLKLMSIELVMPSNHLTLCRPLLLPPSIFPSIRVFSNESVLCIRWPKYWTTTWLTPIKTKVSFHGLKHFSCVIT